MTLKCPRRPGMQLQDTDCPAFILTLATSADLAPCLECEHGKKLAASCPYNVTRVQVATAPAAEQAAPAAPAAEQAAPEKAPKKAPKKTPQKAPTPKPRPAPVRTMDDEIESLRNALAYLLPQKYTTLGVSFVEMVARRYGMTTGILETAAAAGLTVKKVRKTVKIMQNGILWEFVREILTQNSESSSRSRRRS